MNKLNGTLDVTSLSEIIRLCSVQQKTGALTLSRAGIQKTLYFHKGVLIYITSNRPGERVGEYLIQRGDLTRTWAGFLLKDSKRNGIAFTTSLLEKNIFDKKKLEDALANLANSALADVISWTTGSYEFSEKLPQQALNGPIRISEVKALQQLLQQGESVQSQTNTAEILRNVAQKIFNNNFSLPLLPKIAIDLEQAWDETATDGQLMRIVHSDQVLSAYLLRVVNSAIGNKQHVSTIKQALEVYPSDHIIGILHAQIACAQPPKHQDTVSQMSQHALRCACLSEQIAAQLGENQDMAFTCGLFHNIGKVLLLQLLIDGDIDETKLPQLVSRYGDNSGALLSLRCRNCLFKSYTAA
ncbi:MAG: hypothetical protein B6I36_04970 [Desulfobacteraceae bacterium 4572_35.1]|nr:MAG: hypothetical protein B6I36_04970 [Desulfobacteraceae bacterium 4572_35.1]